MAGTTAANLGLVYGWAIADNFKTDMDADLLLIDRVLQLGVKGRATTAPPGSPVSGDRWIVPAGATGAWSGQTGKIAVYPPTGSTWIFITPKTGWVAFVEGENKLTAYYGGAWSAGIAI